MRRSQITDRVFSGSALKARVNRCKSWLASQASLRVSVRRSEKSGPRLRPENYGVGTLAAYLIDHQIARRREEECLRERRARPARTLVQTKIGFLAQIRELHSPIGTGFSDTASKPVDAGGCRSQTRLANRDASVQAVNSMVLQEEEWPRGPRRRQPRRGLSRGSKDSDQRFF